MRFVWAVAAFVLATVMIGAGIAQRTVLQGPKTITEAIAVEESAPYVLIDGAVLGSNAGSQTLRARGDGEIFAAYGRTDDMRAWLGQSEYVQVSLDGERVVSNVVTPEPVAEDDTADSTRAGSDLSPVGSDLWVDEFQQEDVVVVA
ncbi:MAG: glycosyl transferase, partial [Microbacterium sp.]